MAQAHQSVMDRMFFYGRIGTVALPNEKGLLRLGSPTTRVGASSTTGAADVPIGFVFWFDGTAYTTMFVSPRGFVRFAGSHTSGDNTALFGVSDDEIIAPWFDAMKTASSGNAGAVRTEVQGTAPFRRCIVDWVCFSSDADDDSNNDLLSFQLVLYESLDKYAFRYGPRVRTGTPTASSASRGVKGDTTSSSTNFRDLSNPAGTLALGGNTTSPATTLTTTTHYDSFAQYVMVGQPNWPMCRRYHLFSPGEINGYVDELTLWKIANFVNVLRCRHRPPLVNCSTWMPGGGEDEVAFAVPVQPSDDHLVYEVAVQVYAATAGDVLVDVGADDVTHPQVDTDSDWESLGTSTEYATGAAWNEFPAFEVTIPREKLARVLRFKLTSSADDVTAIRGVAIMVQPVAWDDLDLEESHIGFIPMGLAQMIGFGAPWHAEWFNRAFRNIALVLQDLRQCLWSSVWAGSGNQIVPLAVRPTQTIGVSKVGLTGWPKQVAKARIYARDGTGGTILLSEAGNGILAEFPVVVHGDEYRVQTASVSLVSAEPTITATGDPGGSPGSGSALSPATIVLDWAPALSTENLAPGLTPAPRIGYLHAIAARMELALRCTAYAGLATYLARGKGSSNPWRVWTYVGPAVKALRALIARDASDFEEDADASEIIAASSGSGASDKIIVDPPQQRGHDGYPPNGAIGFAVTAEDYTTSPVAPMRRALESPTVTSMEGGARERVQVVHGVGITFTPVPADPTAI